MNNIIVFEHIEKCAGTSVIQALREVYGMHHFDLIPRDKSSMLASQADIVSALRLNPSLKSIAGHSIRGGIASINVPELTLQYYTILRDPVKRMWSDYKYSCDVLGFSGKLESFVAATDRKNFLSKALCGKESYEESIKNLESRYAMFGIVEEFSAFVDGLSWLTGFDLSRYKSKKANAAKVKEDSEFLKHEEFIKDQCDVDIKIYNYAAKLCGKRGCFYQGKSKDRVNLCQVKHSVKVASFQNLLFRNFIYKPYMGYAPFKNHALPLYRGMKKD